MRVTIVVSIVAIAVFAGGIYAAAPTTRAAAGIPDVRSMDELRSSPALSTGDGWRIRVGFAPGGEETAWGLLYCLASYEGKGEPPKMESRDMKFGRPLGPVHWRFERVNVERIAEAGKWSAQWRVPREALYCASMPLAGKGRYRLEVISATGEALARREITVEKDATCYWHVFAQTQQDRKLEFAVRGDCVAAIPTFTMGSPDSSDAQKALKEAGRLPGQVFASGKEELELSLADDVLRIRGGQKMDDDVELYFLALVGERPGQGGVDDVGVDHDPARPGGALQQ